MRCAEHKSTYTEKLQEVANCIAIILGTYEDTFTHVLVWVSSQDLCIIVLAEHLGVVFIVCGIGYQEPVLDTINEAEMLEPH